MSGLYRFFTTSYWLGRAGYIKAGEIDLLKNAPTTDDDIERIDISFARKAREAVRYLGANNPDIAAIVRADKNGIVGSTINIQSKVPGQPEINRDIEKFLKKWSKKGNCELTGRFTFNSAMRAMVEFTDKDGGFLVRHHVRTEWDVPYRFELIELGMIDTTRYDDKKNLFNGLQRDRDGRITGIYLYKTQERRESSLVSMTELEYFSPVWISLSQYTAVTQLATVLPTLNKLDQYTDAELQAALNRAKNGKYWKTALYDDLMKIVKAQQEEETRKQQLTTLLERISEKGVKADGLTPIPLSDDVLRIDEPSASVFPNLAKNAKQNIAAGAGSASQLVYRDGTDANYSSLKGILGMVGIEWDTRFNDLTEEIVDFILGRAIRAGVAVGKLNIPDFWLDPDEYAQFDYMRNATIDIEPLKTANANAKNYETGSVSLTEICRRRGRDVEDVLRERISEQLLAERIRKELGAGAPSEPEGGIDNGTT